MTARARPPEGSQPGSRRPGFDPWGRAGLATVVLVTLLALTAPWVAPFAPNQPDFDTILSAPGTRHLFGTDQLGRDVLSRVWHAARTALWVGSVSVACSFVLGGIAGLVAGSVGGWIDTGLMLITDVILAFPAVLLALALAAMLGPGLFNVTLAIAIGNLPAFARVARAQTRVVRALGFVEAQQALGFGPTRILFGTIAPHVLPALITQATLLFAASILIESYLSFLGLGAQPPTPTWGQMLHEATGFLALAPWLAWFPGCAICTTVIGFTLLGDAMSERLDPRDVLPDLTAGKR